MASYNINVDEIREYADVLCAGDEVYLTGTVYTARDAAHKKIKKLIENGEKLPFELDGAVIYYAGPTPERPGAVIGSCGPTTSSRMDVYTPLFIEKGLAAMIGKGPRDMATVEAIKKYGATYFCAIGGAGALAAQSVKSLEVIAFEELGCESVKKLYVEKFPVMCAIDCHGGNAFER